MKIDIPYYIRQILREHREVHVPGVGVFHLRQLSASFAEDKATIIPPSLQLHFDSTQTDNTDLLQYILDVGKHSKKKIQSAIADFTDSAFSGLITGDPFHIDGVGTLHKDQDSEAVSFVSSLSDLTKEYKDLPTIVARPIERISAAQSVDHAVDMGDISARSSKSTWWYPIAAGILIALLAILSVETCRNSNADGEYNSMQSDPVDKQDDSPILADSVNQGEIDKKYKEVDSLLQGRVDSGLGGGKLAEELELLEPEGAVRADDKKKASVIKKFTAVEPKTVAKVPESASKSEYSDVIPASGQCIIVLGSFSKASNITKMMSLVERNGYTLYRSQYNGLTRVGFRFDCSNVAIDDYLVEIRKRYAPKAWYLDPTVSIPYQ